MKSLTLKQFCSLGLIVSTVGLTACQSTSTNQYGMYHGNHHSHKMWQEKHEQLTEGQILSVLSTANKGEIMQANAAMPSLRIPQIRDYAQKMINAHSMNEQKVANLGNHLQLVPQASNTSNALQTDSNSIVGMLNQRSNMEDHAYIKSQIKVHRKVLMTIDNQLLPNASNPELRDFLIQTRADVVMHLNMAKQIMSVLK